MKILTAILLVGLGLPTSARIGENPDQLVARYGPSNPGRNATELLFEKNGIVITATLWKGVCDSLRFGPVPVKGRFGVFGTGFVHPDDVPTPDPPKVIGKPLTGEFKHLLEANAGGSP